VSQWFKWRTDQLLAAAVITSVLMGLVVLIPAVGRQLKASSVPTPTPSPSVTPAPVAVLLPDELSKALQGVMTLANDRTFGTAFLIDAQGDFLSTASLVDGSPSLRLIDNTGGSHAVRLMGTDSQTGLAMVRALTDGTPLAIGDSSPVAINDPLMLLAAPKVQNLSPSMPATVLELDQSGWRLRSGDLPGNLGGPLLGPGAKVLGVLTRPAIALPVSAANSEIANWQRQVGTLMPLAGFPSGLILRGSDTTNSPTASATVNSVSPPRVSSTFETTVSIQGAGFVAGNALRVHFTPVASASGGFDGLAATLAGASSVTVKISAGHPVGDYVIELINGDGTVVSSRVAFTITP
jgi:hypothetical protein